MTGTSALGPDELVELMRHVAALCELSARVLCYAELLVSDEGNGALRQEVQERLLALHDHRLHRLSESEELTLAPTSITGNQAWVACWTT
jgi:hypothetical protein